MAEWLRRLTRNQMGSSRVGSNPTRSGHFSVYVQIVKFSYLLKSVQILHAEVIFKSFLWRLIILALRRKSTLTVQMSSCNRSSKVFGPVLVRYVKCVAMSAHCELCIRESCTVIVNSVWKLNPKYALLRIKYQVARNHKHF